VQYCAEISDCPPGVSINENETPEGISLGQRILPAPTLAQSGVQSGENKQGK
jgi:hypothetical protein